MVPLIAVASGVCERADNGERDIASLLELVRVRRYNSITDEYDLESIIDPALRP